MQVDSEIIFTDKGPVMVNESKKNQNGLFRGQYLAIKVTQRSKTAQNRNHIT